MPHGPRRRAEAMAFLRECVAAAAWPEVGFADVRAGTPAPAFGSVAVRLRPALPEVPARRVYGARFGVRGGVACRGRSRGRGARRGRRKGGWNGFSTHGSARRARRANEAREEGIVARAGSLPAPRRKNLSRGFGGRSETVTSGARARALAPRLVAIPGPSAVHGAATTSATARCRASCSASGTHGAAISK